MSENDRMERLEARVARLEELLAGKRESGEAGQVKEHEQQPILGVGFGGPRITPGGWRAE
jgi:hypothetical protein